MSEQEEHYATLDQMVFAGQIEARLAGISPRRKEMTFINYACLERQYAIDVELLNLENPKFDKALKLHVTWRRNVTGNGDSVSDWKHSTGHGTVHNIWKAIRDDVMHYVKVMEGEAS